MRARERQILEKRQEIEDEKRGKLFKRLEEAEKRKEEKLKEISDRAK